MAWMPTTTVADLEWSVSSMVVKDQPRYLVQKGSVVTIKDLVKSSQERVVQSVERQQQSTTDCLGRITTGIVERPVKIITRAVLSPKPGSSVHKSDVRAVGAELTSDKACLPLRQHT